MLIKNYIVVFSRHDKKDKSMPLNVEFEGGLRVMN